MAEQRTIASGPLSSETTYVIAVTGPFGEREARRLIQIAEFLREVVSDDATPDQPGEGSGE
jgi:hypothetical protein